MRRRQKKRKRPALLKVASYEYGAAGSSWSAQDHARLSGHDAEGCVDSAQSGSASHRTAQSAGSGPWWRDAYQKPRAGHLGEHSSSFGFAAGSASPDAVGGGAKGRACEDGGVADTAARMAVAAAEVGASSPADSLAHGTGAARCANGDGQSGVRAEPDADPGGGVSGAAANEAATCSGAASAGSSTGAVGGAGAGNAADVGASACDNATDGDAAPAGKADGSTDDVAKDATAPK